jgi:hypothetical protein
MGTQWGQIVKEESKRNPGIGEYTKCQSGVFAYSTLSMITGEIILSIHLFYSYLLS